MFSIEKRFTLEYAHRLHLMPAGHNCGNVHGHSGVVIVKIETPNLDNADFVIDFGELGFVKDWLDTNWDHATLLSDNDLDLKIAMKSLKSKRWVLPRTYRQTTSENFCNYLYGMISKELSKRGLSNFRLEVGFSETQNNTAWYNR